MNAQTQALYNGINARKAIATAVRKDRIGIETLSLMGNSIGYRAKSG